MRAIDLADELKELYENKHIKCNMSSDTCGDKPCDLCRIEQFAKETRDMVLDEFVKTKIDVLSWIMERQEEGRGTTGGELLDHIYEIVESLKGGE